MPGSTTLSHIDTSFGLSPHHSGQSQQQQAPPPPQLVEPIYEPEATYNVGTGPLDMDAMNIVFDGSGSGLSDEVLATMQAIKNPAWWQNMMMPG